MRVKKENPLRQLPANSNNYGEIKIHLKEILEERDISLNQLSFRAEMQRTQLRNYYSTKYLIKKSIYQMSYTALKIFNFSFIIS